MATTDATVTDVERLEQIHTDLNRRNLLPGEHIVDAGYTSAELLVGTQRDFGITLLGPLRIDNSQQARTGGGFDRTAFTIDWDNQRVTCPQGVTNTIWSECTERGRESIMVPFPTPRETRGHQRPQSLPSIDATAPASDPPRTGSDRFE